MKQMTEEIYDKIWSYVVKHANPKDTAVSIYNELSKNSIIEAPDSTVMVRDVFECISSALEYGCEKYF